MSAPEFIFTFTSIRLGTVPASNSELQPVTESVSIAREEQGQATETPPPPTVDRGVQTHPAAIPAGR